MKQRHRLTLPLVAILGLFALAGCSTTQRTKAAQTLLVAGETINSAMNVYGELYRSDALTEEQVEEVREKHAKFQSLYSQAVSAVEFDLTELTPPELATVISDLILTIDSLEQ